MRTTRKRRSSIKSARSRSAARSSAGFSVIRIPCSRSRSTERQRRESRLGRAVRAGYRARQTRLDRANVQARRRRRGSRAIRRARPALMGSSTAGWSAPTAARSCAEAGAAAGARGRRIDTARAAALYRHLDRAQERSLDMRMSRIVAPLIAAIGAQALPVSEAVRSGAGTVLAAEGPTSFGIGASTQPRAAARRGRHPDAGQRSAVSVAS